MFVRSSALGLDIISLDSATILGMVRSERFSESLEWPEDVDDVPPSPFFSKLEFLDGDPTGVVIGDEVCDRADRAASPVTASLNSVDFTFL